MWGSDELSEKETLKGPSHVCCRLALVDAIDKFSGTTHNGLPLDILNHGRYVSEVREQLTLVSFMATFDVTLLRLNPAGSSDPLSPAIVVGQGQRHV